MATFIARLRQSWEEELRQKATQDAGRRPNDDGRRRVRLDFVGFAQRCFCELKPSRARSTGADPLRHPLVFGRPSVASVARGSGARRQIVARLPADHRQRLVPPDLSDPPLARTAGGAGVRGDGAGAAGSRPRSAGADRAPSRLDHHRRSVEAGGGLVRGPAGRRQRVVRPYALPAAERQAAECDRDDHHRLHESLSSGVTRGTISWAGGLGGRVPPGDRRGRRDAARRHGLGPILVPRHQGEALQPAREPMPMLDKIRRTIGEYNFTGHYHQMATPLGGGLASTEASANGPDCPKPSFAVPQGSVELNGKQTLGILRKKYADNRERAHAVSALFARIS